MENVTLHLVAVLVMMYIASVVIAFLVQMKLAVFVSRILSPYFKRKLGSSIAYTSFDIVQIVTFFALALNGAFPISALLLVTLLVRVLEPIDHASSRNENSLIWTALIVEIIRCCAVLSISVYSVLSLNSASRLLTQLCSRV